MHLLKELYKNTNWNLSQNLITLGLLKPISVKKRLLTNFINKKDPVLKGEFHTKYEKIEIYSLPIWKKVNRLIMINILKEIGIILRTHGKESNPLFL